MFYHLLNVYIDIIDKMTTHIQLIYVYSVDVYGYILQDVSRLVPCLKG